LRQVLECLQQINWCSQGIFECPAEIQTGENQVKRFFYLPLRVFTGSPLTIFYWPRIEPFLTGFAFHAGVFCFL
jgi:hypothetical protein